MQTRENFTFRIWTVNDVILFLALILLILNIPNKIMK